MPSEDWIQRWKAAQFLYDWQTLIAGVLALVAAIGTIWATRSAARRQIAASQESTAVAERQIETTIHLEHLRGAREGFAFYAMFEAAMDRVLAEAADARKEFPGPSPGLERRAYFARTSFSKKAFNELRGACLTHGSRLTEKFLELEKEIDDFASRVMDGEGIPTALLAELDSIESVAKQLRAEAIVGRQTQADLIDAETEPPIQMPG
jgi:hypothetical protein